jgi:simple sugar transport system substrate-binding protein
MLITSSWALAQEEEFVFGVILVGPGNDGGWSQAHKEGADYVVEHMPNTRYLLYESLNAADAPEASLQQVVQEMIGEGAKLIFTTSDYYKEDTPVVAASFPDVIFINISGDNVPQGNAPENMGNQTGRLADARQLAGCAAALQSQTGSIGFVGPFPNNEALRDENTAYLGAKDCWEKKHGTDEGLAFTVTWIGFFFHIPGVTLDPAEVTAQLLDGGADVIISGIDTLEPIHVTAERYAQGQQVWAIGTDSPTVCENTPEPESCLGSQYHNWGPSYLSTVEAVRSGVWNQEEHGFQWLSPDWTNINNLDTSHVGFVSGPGMGEENHAVLDQYIAEIAEFQLDPANENYLFNWCADEEPINLQDGSMLVAPGECLPGYQLPAEGPSMWYMTQLLEGMTGTSTTD